MTSGIERFGDFSEVPGLPIISKGVVHNGVLYTCGFCGEPEEDISGQTAQALAKVDETLQSAGSNRSMILSAQVWLKDMADFDAHNEVWDKWVDPANAPVRACVRADLYDPRLLVELRVIAAMNPSLAKDRM